MEIRPGRGPIWQQIEDGIRRMISSRALRCGQAAPSVRKLAQALGVTPATVDRAYRDLIAAGVLVARRGRGTFVSERARTNSDRERALEEAAIHFAEVARTLGAPIDEAHSELVAAFERMAESVRTGLSRSAG